MNSLSKYKDLALKVIYYTKKRQIGNKFFLATSKFQEVLEYFEKNLKDSQTFLKSCYFLNGKQIYPSDILLYFCIVDPSLRLVEEDLFLEIEELEHLDDASEPIHEKLLKPLIDPFKLIILNIKEGILQQADFPKENITQFGLDTINNNFACCNSTDSLYISCGKNFWIISQNNFHITKKEMPFFKERHSMTFVLSKNIVFIAGGGEDSFYYDINSKEFIVWGKMNVNQEQPALIQFGDYIYSFNSFNQKGIFFERTKLTNPAKIWEKLIPQSGDQESGFFYNKLYGVSKCAGGNILFAGGINNQLRTFIYNLKLNVLYINSSKDESILLTERNFYKIDHNYNIAIPKNIEKDHIIAIVNKNSKTLNLVPFENISVKDRNNLLRYDNPRNRLPGSIFIKCRYMSMKDYENFMKQKEEHKNNKSKEGFDIYNRKEQGKKGDNINGDPYKYQYRGKLSALEKITEGKSDEEDDDDMNRNRSSSAKKNKRTFDLGLKLENIGKFNFSTQKKEDNKKQEKKENKKIEDTKNGEKTDENKNQNNIKNKDFNIIETKNEEQKKINENYDLNNKNQKENIKINNNFNKNDNNNIDNKNLSTNVYEVKKVENVIVEGKNQESSDHILKEDLEDNISTSQTNKIRNKKNIVKQVRYKKLKIDKKEEGEKNGQKDIDLSSSPQNLNINNIDFKEKETKINNNINDKGNSKKKIIQNNNIINNINSDINLSLENNQNYQMKRIIPKSKTDLIIRQNNNKNINNNNSSKNPFANNAKYQFIVEKELHNNLNEENGQNLNKINPNNNNNINVVKQIKTISQKSNYKSNTSRQIQNIDQGLIPQSNSNNNNQNNINNPNTINNNQNDIINNKHNKIRKGSYKALTNINQKGKKIINKINNQNIKINISNNESEYLKYSEIQKRKDINVKTEGNHINKNNGELFLKIKKKMQNFENRKLNTLDNAGANILRINKTVIIMNNTNNLSTEKITKGDNNKKSNNFIVTKDGKKYILSKKIQKERKVDNKIENAEQIKIYNNMDSEGNKNI